MPAPPLVEEVPVPPGFVAVLLDELLELLEVGLVDVLLLLVVLVVVVVVVGVLDVLLELVLDFELEQFWDASLLIAVAP